jgi:hypothetical protein
MNVERFRPSAGNPVRMKGKLALKFDQEWQQHLPSRDRWTTELLCVWLMSRYGYKRASKSN